MIKSELEIKLHKEKSNNKLMKESLVKIRQVARDRIHKADGSSVNNVWLIEEITTTLAKIGD